MDRGAWQATVHRVAQSWTQLKRLFKHTQPVHKLGSQATWATQFPLLVNDSGRLLRFFSLQFLLQVTVNDIGPFPYIFLSSHCKSLSSSNSILWVLTSIHFDDKMSLLFYNILYKPKVIPIICTFKIIIHHIVTLLYWSLNLHVQFIKVSVFYSFLYDAFIPSALQYIPTKTCSR